MKINPLLIDGYTKVEIESLLLTKQPLIDSTHKLSSDLVDDTNGTNKFVSATEKSNISKALYHLGKYDSQDGKTRQTGYAIINANDVSVENLSVYLFKVPNTKLKNCISHTSNEIVSTATVNTYTSNEFYGSTSKYGMAVDNNNTIFIRISGITTLADMQSYLASNPIYIQYQLASSYTDTPIANESILPLDTNMASELRGLITDGLNLFDKTKEIDGYGVLVDNGQLYAETNEVASDYIEVEPNTTYSNNIVGGFSSGLGVAFYNSSKTFISGIGSNLSTFNSFTTPSNTKYLRLTYNKTTTSNVMLNEGNHVYPYQAYNGRLARIPYVNRAMYNLGVFDNDDGNTRKTGILILEEQNWNYLNDYDRPRYEITLSSAVLPSNNDGMPSIVCDNYTVRTPNDAWGQKNGISLDPNAKLIVYGTTKPSGKVEYKLLSTYQYQDTIIPNQPLLNLDSNMANKIHQKVVDGLNLFTTDSWVSNRAVSSCSYSFENSIIKFTNISGNDPYAYMNFSGFEIGKTYTISYISDKTLQSAFFGQGNEILTNSKYGSYSFVADQTTYELGFEFYSTEGSTCNIQIMLVEGSHSYPHSDFNQKEHITNDEATLLKKEEEKCRNLWNYQGTMTNTNVGVTVTLNNSVLTLSGTNDGNGGWALQNIPLNLKAGTYTIKYNGISSNLGFSINIYMIIRTTY